ncbi:hypothetical protein P4V56_29675 [Brevibacillus porteri]|nr:hypothetical protein [Brevibacillus porteri]
MLSWSLLRAVAFSFSLAAAISFSNSLTSFTIHQSHVPSAG